jgi:hypothetical protein
MVWFLLLAFIVAATTPLLSPAEETESEDVPMETAAVDAEMIALEGTNL